MTEYKCVSDRYEPYSHEPYDGLEEFLNMCEYCFGERPELRRIGSDYYDSEGLVLEAI